jgi:glycosyltransferase involved in cell wall biosynthesis
MSTLPPSICLVAHSAYGALAGDNSGHIGGVERQTSLMAKWLAAKGYGVSMLTWDEGQPDDLVVAGVRVIKICGAKAGLPGLRFFHPKWTGLVRAMRQADAEVYYQNCGECVTGQAALWCRRHGRKFVYSVASDPDCDPRLPEMRTVRERVLYRYGLRRADRVVVQTRRQQTMLREGFGLESEIIPMPCSGPGNGEEVERRLPQPNARRVLWIGRICEVKRPDRFLDLAESCPDLVFDLVGPTFDADYSQAAYKRAKGLANVTVHGPVAFGQVAEFYRRAACLCCTSDFEGFPNTFIEAWGHGVPLVSTFDPDNIIATRGLGIVARDVAGLARGIRELFGSAERWGAASARARQYYLENHTVESAMGRFERVFLDAVGSTAGAPGAERR